MQRHPALQALTPKQARFVIAYTTPGDGFLNATQAARTAGYQGGDNTLAVIGWENVRKPKIAKAVQAILHDAYQATDVTVEKVLRDLEMIKQLAIRDADYGAAIRATIKHGEYLRMFYQRIEHLHTLEDVTLEELLELATRLGSKIDGLNFGTVPGADAPEGGSSSGPAGDRVTH